MKFFYQSKKFLGLTVLAVALLLFGAMLRAPGGGSLAERAGQLLGLDNATDTDEELPPPAPVPTSPPEVAAQAHDVSALGGYNVLIADRGNNRLIEVTPDKKIVWQYHFDLPQPGLGADDAFFADNGQSIIVNLEEYHVIELIDYQTKQVVWQYGTPGKPGSDPGFLNTPDDAYRLPNGDVIVADIKNCRVIEIAPDKKIVRQYGVTKQCGNRPGELNKPNGDTPLPNGHVFISNIVGHNLLELDQNWRPVATLTFPISYPSDPQPTRAGNILISNYVTPGKILELTPAGKVVWEFDGDTAKLDRPSLALELPNGNILANDDFNHRVIVIDKQTKQILWQYGVTRKPGLADGQLNIPDGLDIIKRETGNPAAGSAPLHTVGDISRHPTAFVGQIVRLKGYVLQQAGSYVIISDEISGPVGPFDLPVNGDGIGSLMAKQSYVLQGRLVYQGLAASNRNPYHLELVARPEPGS